MQDHSVPQNTANNDSMNVVVRDEQPAAIPNKSVNVLQSLCACVFKKKKEKLNHVSCMYMCFSDVGEKATNETLREAPSAWFLFSDCAVTTGLSLPGGH